MRHPTKHLRLFLASLAAAGLLAVIAAPAVHAGQHNAAPGLARAIAAQELYTADLLAIPGVVGTAVGLGPNGDPMVKIYTAAGGIAGLPRTLDGVGVRVEVTGRLFALHHACGHDGGPPGSDPFPCDPPPPDGEEEVDPTAKFDPVPIGVSSGTVESIQIVFPFITCSSGTLGAWLTGGGNHYALSNNHIYALENTAQLNATDHIVQPGPGDNDPVCSDGSLENPSDSIGKLAAFVDIEFDVVNEDGTLNENPTDNKVDAAIALHTNRAIDTGTPVDGYGTPKSAVLVCDPDPLCGNLMGLSIQKYGRTTGLTKGTITGINATINVGYDSGIAQFVGQIEVTGNKGGFFKGGDSGSLLVIDDAGNADDLKPVGLMFAGPRSGKMGFANQIKDVLDLLHAEPGISPLSVDGS